MARNADQWPILREYFYPSGRSAWMVDCGRIKVNGTVRRERYFFELKKEAETKRDLLRIERTNNGIAFFELEPTEREDAKKALEILSPYGATLRDAAKFYAENIEVIRAKKLVPEVVNELLAAKIQDGKADRYIRDIRVRLNAFAKAFETRLIHEIKTPDLETYLRSLKVGPVSRNNVKRLLGVLFSFAKDQHYTLSNPAEATAKAKVIHDKPGILTVEETRALLECAGADILPAISLGAFAGLRPESECWRLDWSQINLDEREIDVGKSKNLGSERFVKISDNLAEWLKPHVKSRGPVSPQQAAYFDRVRDLRGLAAAKLEAGNKNAVNLREWSSDCLRHSFASYHFALHKNAHGTAEQLGHAGSLTIFYRHYRNRVKEAEAIAYWAIRPASAT